MCPRLFESITRKLLFPLWFRENSDAIFGITTKIRWNDASIPLAHLKDGTPSVFIRAAINWVFAYTDAAGRQIELDEVAYQEWRDGKIIRERFYYDPAQRLRGV